MLYNLTSEKFLPLYFRMRASDVLVVGANGLTGEVMKNIVLAGINSLTILDNSVVNTSCFLVHYNIQH